MIKYKLILLVMGILLIIESIFMCISAAVSLFYRGDDLYALGLSTIITFVAGSCLFLLFRKTDKKVGKREAFMIVSLCWIILSIFGSLPFIISDQITTVADAFFETMSGFTTTGASILNDIESLPKGLLFWRSITQWVGGMGIIVLSMAIIPFVKIGGTQLFSAEVTGTGIANDKLHPRIRGTAKKLWLLYIGLTILEAILLFAGGMTGFDSICHSLTTMASGGYSTKQDSIAFFSSPYIQYVIIIFMIIAGTNFSMIYFSITGQFRKVTKNTELKFYILIILVVSFIIGLGLWYFMDLPFERSIRDSLFQVVSILTTTGFMTSDYLTWKPIGLWVILILLMFIGGSTNSTSGGVKVARIHILFRNIRIEFKRIIHPHAVLPVRYNKSSLPQQIINNTLAFIVLYILIIAVGTVIMVFAGLDLESAFGAVATSLGNVGPGIGSVGPSETFAHINDFGKYFLSFLMLLGRLELFTVLIIFTKAFWKK